jgi:hypothetical protein
VAEKVCPRSLATTEGDMQNRAKRRLARDHPPVECFAAFQEGRHGMLIGTSITLHLEDDHADDEQFDHSDHIAIVFSVGAGYAEIETHSGSRHVRCTLDVRELEQLARDLARLVAKARELETRDREASES